MRYSINRKLNRAYKRLAQFNDKYGHTDKVLQNRLSFHGARDLGYLEGSVTVLENLMDEIEETNSLVLDIKLDDEEIKELLKDGNGVITIPQDMTVTTINSELYDVVVKFMKEQDITCEETIHQMDNVIENAYDFITDLFNIVKDDLDIEEED